MKEFQKYMKKKGKFFIDDKNIQLDVYIANGFYQRLKGLLGLRSMEPNTAILLTKCNSIHTFFMKFSIDVIYLDRNFKIISVYRNVKPGRFLLPNFMTKSVLECSAGTFPEWLTPGHSLQFGEL